MNSSSEYDTDLDNGSSSQSMAFNDSVIWNYVLPTLNVLELSVYIPTIPLAIFCQFLVVKTAVLHTNLKWILFAVCLQIQFFALTRLFATIITKFSWLEYGSILATILLFSLNFTLIVYGNLIGHVLIIERILATVLVQKYEAYRSTYFTVAWIFITLILTVSNTYYQSLANGNNIAVSKVTLYTHIIAMIASFAEIFIMFVVTRWNEKRFKIDYNAPKLYPLTVRYQLTENIRTGRQLAPTFLCHFISVLLSFLVVMNLNYKCFTNFITILLLTEIAFVIHSVNNFMLLVTLITFHPLLNRRAKRILTNSKKKYANFTRQFFPSRPNTNHSVAPRTNSVHTIDLCPLPVETNGRHYMVMLNNHRNDRKSVGGGTMKASKCVGMQRAKVLPMDFDQTETYFRQLQRAWGDKML